MPTQAVQGRLFWAAAPRRVQGDGATIDPRVRGDSYKAELYEQAIGRALDHVPTTRSS